MVPITADTLASACRKGSNTTYRKRRVVFEVLNALVLELQHKPKLTALIFKFTKISRSAYPSLSSGEDITTEKIDIQI